MRDDDADLNYASLHHHEVTRLFIDRQAKLKRFNHLVVESKPDSTIVSSCLFDASR